MALFRVNTITHLDPRHLTLAWETLLGTGVRRSSNKYARSEKITKPMESIFARGKSLEVQQDIKLTRGDL